jgi:hypothetical protein
MSSGSNNNNIWASRNVSNPDTPLKVNETHYNCDITPKKQQEQKQKQQPDAPKKLNTTNRASSDFNPKRLKFDS